MTIRTLAATGLTLLTALAVPAVARADHYCRPSYGYYDYDHGYSRSHHRRYYSGGYYYYVPGPRVYYRTYYYAPPPPRYYYYRRRYSRPRVSIYLRW